jgi:RNA polymerase sigma-70 factor, ECF subfamily
MEGTRSKVMFAQYTDEDLVVAIAQKNTLAVNTLYDRYGQKLFHYFYRMLWKNKELAEDYTQELFLKIIQHASTFQLGLSFTTWMYSIAHNMCKNEYRKETVKMNYAKEKIKEPEKIILEKNIDLQNFTVAVANCIEQLGVEKQSLFILRFQQNLTIPQISTILHIAEGTVKSRLFYLLKEMKEDLIQYKNIHLTI